MNMQSVSIVIMMTCSLITGCATRSIHPKYFILDYKPVLRDSTLKIEKSLPYKVQVQTMKIPRSFDRISIVVRYSAHQLDYYRYNLWAIRPQFTISDLIANHITEYGVFQKCRREFLEEQPDFEITGEINAIEQFAHESYAAAHLAMRLSLRTYDGYEELVVHEFDREEELPVSRMELFAKKLSDIVREETDIFIRQVIDHFQERSKQ